MATDCGKQAVVKVLLDRGADIEAKDKQGWTPMHFAAGMNKEPSIVTVLLGRGANVQAKTNDGETPLDLATHRDNTAAIQVLRHHATR